jgi:hypothetical protein
MERKRVKFEGTRHCDVCQQEKETCAKVYVRMGNPNDISMDCVDI